MNDVKDNMKELFAANAIIESPEYLKLSIESGEIIHSIGNIIADGTAQIGSLTKTDGMILRELGEALRSEYYRKEWNEENTVPRFPALIAQGFNPAQYSNSLIAAIAGRIIGNEGLTSFHDALRIENEISEMWDANKVGNKSGL